MQCRPTENLALDPKLPGLQLIRAALFKQQNFKEAIAPLKLRCSPLLRIVKPRSLLALSYYGSAQFAEAVRYLEPAVPRLLTICNWHGAGAELLWSAKYDAP